MITQPKQKKRNSPTQKLDMIEPFSPDPPGQLYVLGHDGDPLGVDGAQVGVLEQTYQVRLAPFLCNKMSFFILISTLTC